MISDIRKINKLADKIREKVGEKYPGVDAILGEIIETAEEVQDEVDAFSNQVNDLQYQLDNMKDNDEELAELAELKEIFEDMIPSTVEDELKLKILRRLYKEWSLSDLERSFTQK